MVLDKKETTVAYRCPECGASVMGMVGIFTLSADMIRLKCPCGGSELEIIYNKDKKIRLNVPCFLCPTPHSYILSTQMFFDRGLFALSCGYSGIDICFIGTQDEVQKAMESSENELLEMLGDSDFQSLSKVRRKNLELTDPQIFDIVMYIVHELADEGKIRCGCENDGEYEVEINDDYLTVKCKKCSCSLDIPTNSLTAAEDFLKCEELELRSDEQK